MSNPNPFGGPNPFADPAVTVHTESAANDTDGGSYGVVPATSAWGTNPSPWGGSTTSPTNGRKLTQTERELSIREEEIKKREKQLEEQQRELHSQNRHADRDAVPRPVKNWPPCFPVLYHDIEAEVTFSLQSTIKRAYHSYLLFCGTVIYNFLCVTLALSTGGNFIAWLFAGKCIPFDIYRGGAVMAGCLGIYAISGIPGAFIIWYRRLYNAAAYDRSVTFMCYFLGSAIHVGFCAWAAVPVPTFFLGASDDSSFTGLIEVFQKFDDELWLGVFYLIGFVLWIGNIVLSVYVWQQAMREFRGRGGPQQVQSQAQATAGNVALAAVTQRHV